MVRSLFLVLLLLPAPSFALGSFSLSQSDIIGTTSISGTRSTAYTMLEFSTVTVGTVALAIEIEEMLPSAQSPHHNVTVISSGVLNDASVDSNGGITTVQQTAGGSNVTMSMNNIIVGAGGLAGTSAPTATASNNPTVLLVGVLNQPFTVKNSYWFAQVLNKKLLVDAFIAGSATNGNAIAEDIITVGLNEFSPHHNLGITSTAVNTAGVTGNFGIVTIQQTAGFSNVTESMNTLIVGTGIFSTSGVVVSP